MAKLRFTGSRTGKGSGEIYLDDRRVYGVNGLHLESNPQDIDRLTLDFVVYDGMEIERDVIVQVGVKTHESLVALGWTPPAPRA